MLRIRPTADGGYVIPEGNLFTHRAEGRPEIFVMGCRNPWRISVDSETGTLYWVDVGPDASADSDRGSRGFDELNQARQPGFFGWSYFIADNRPYADYDFTAEVLGPRFDAAHPENTSPNNTGSRHLPPAQPAWVYYPYGASAGFPELDAPGGRTACAGPVYHFDPALASRTKFPVYYDDCLFAFEWSRHWVKTMRLGADEELVEIRPFLTGIELKRPVDQKFGPEGALYLLEYGTTWGTNADSRLVRIDYTRGNRTPIARASATGNVGREPLEVALSSAGTSDKDAGDPLTYEWRVEPGDAIFSREPMASLVFDEPGVFTVELAVTDAAGARSSPTARGWSGTSSRSPSRTPERPASSSFAS